MQKTIQKFDFLVVGGGIFGITAVIELAKRKYRAALINPDSIPHHLAASTDVTKAVRMEYGSDTSYFKMAEICVQRWKDWNDLFNTKLYHEVGFLMLCKSHLNSEHQHFEKHSYDNLIQNGYRAQRLNREDLKKQFPGINSLAFEDACYNPDAGYAESGLTVEVLKRYARSLGVSVCEGQTLKEMVINSGKVQGIKTKEGTTFYCDHAIIAAGSSTPYVIPELSPYMKSTGHPVFWVKPENPMHFNASRFPVFTVDISNSGWYGFPFLPKHGIIKFAKHAAGTVIHPDKDDRHVGQENIRDLRTMLQYAFPELKDAPLVNTRLCLYTDTLDGHFWIDNHPDIKGLSVSTGGSGHAFKMAPLLGELTADMAEGKSHPFSKRFRWRHLTSDSLQAEEARCVTDRRL
ncbi:FAD-dependent oxidoreductase [Fulvivirga sp. M361]|uniref:NAD(P)/FAD-dependent oxidoreductase n=1 Tax=Fulvivirga sp. M361 TaxID=2594266 RepID=UPI001179A693|nr:FAD-dependent oxidoreductase [Fulvivirga sp. M361]TRX59934.1 FAD-dependent oxidoreductase [Fulvivirga sp. M361]